LQEAHDSKEDAPARGFDSVTLRAHAVVSASGPVVPGERGGRRSAAVERSCATGPCGLPAANPCRMPADVGNVKPKTSKDIRSQGMTWQTEAEAIPSLLVGQVGSLRKADMVPSLLVGQVGSLRRADMVPSMLEGQDGSLQRTDAVPSMLVDQEGSLRRTGFEPGASAAAVVQNSWQWRDSQHNL